MQSINYSNIGKAIDFYQSLDYEYIEVPWIVSEHAINATLPPGAIATKTNMGYLVGSAEQAFVEMMLKNQLKNKKYVAASPCFRDEIEDEWHQKTFFKVELISIFESGNLEEIYPFVKQMIGDAYSFFQSLDTNNLKIEKTFLYENTFMLHDINLNGIEIGSYGIRKFEHLTWIYGTGLAEPRFSMAKKYE